MRNSIASAWSAPPCPEGDGWPSAVPDCVLQALLRVLQARLRVLQALLHSPSEVTRGLTLRLHHARIVTRAAWLGKRGRATSARNRVRSRSLMPCVRHRLVTEPPTGSNAMGGKFADMRDEIERETAVRLEAVRNDRIHLRLAGVTFVVFGLCSRLWETSSNAHSVRCSLVRVVVPRQASPVRRHPFRPGNRAPYGTRHALPAKPTPAVKPALRTPWPRAGGSSSPRSPGCHFGNGAYASRASSSPPRRPAPWRRASSLRG